MSSETSSTGGPQRPWRLVERRRHAAGTAGCCESQDPRGSGEGRTGCGTGEACFGPKNYGKLGISIFYYIILYYIILNYIMLYYIKLYYVILYYIILYYIIYILFYFIFFCFIFMFIYTYTIIPIFRVILRFSTTFNLIA